MSDAANTDPTTSGTRTPPAPHNPSLPPDADQSIKSPATPVLVGILPADEIMDEVKENRIIKGGIESSVQACSYDMRIGTIFRHGRIIKGQQAAGDVVLVEPGEIISVFTLEELDLPADVAATVFPINAMSSEGLLVLNPGHVDPGFKGPLTVRAINIRATSKSIDLGTPIFTVIFERLSRPTPKPYTRSVDRQQREIKFNATDVEQNPKSMANLVMLGAVKPLITGEEVDRRIENHWMSKVVIVGTIITVALSAIAAIFAVIAVFKASPSQPVIVNPPQGGQIAPPSTINSPLPSGGANNSNQLSTQPQGNAKTTTNRNTEGSVKNQN